MAKEIELQNGMKAIVDDEDYERVSQYNCTIYRPKDTYVGISMSSEGKQKSLPQFILGFGDKDIVITHKNKNKLDCRKCNLLVTDRKGLTHTSRGHRESTSQYKGVCWYKRCKLWMASITVDGKKKHLGYFQTEAEAAIAYNEAAKKYFGQNAYLNAIGEDNSALTIKIPKTKKVGRIAKKKKCKYRGVHQNVNTFYVRVKGKYISSHKTEIEAAKAYNEKAKELFGDKAILNDIPNKEESTC